ncbi:hypothetical protein [Bacillus wiedmannii]|uniref:hypothetical protein n=1 Tax=Bacillus wiedmannii TaxID=1890302 RepID=UPI000BF056E9|nr:hypothetical protein [Bacillus wiedmannii]MDP1459634.1 hypothetical protein [Bacillus wiedmannii]PEJ78680.1 hypothetical protein CN685_05360 [Bacillus wiedmannii]
MDPPINLASLANNAIYDQDIVSIQKYYAMSGLLLEMMNVDGICIVDEKARIRAYNTFIQLNDNTGIQGGARRRAAQSLIDAKPENVLGVYFQSQDGYCFYERIDRDGE